ncbi:MAG: hypothetical protein EA378_06235 [Phycisphaerales bacterium]|nr:MAG: hypothetical protein EA378_06235 [Phycisphaerales bacterium]
MNRLIAAVALSACAGLAAADTIDLSYQGTQRGGNFNVTVDGNTSGTFAGQIRQNLSNGTGIGTQFNGLSAITYCADLEQQVFTNSAPITYNIVDLATIPEPSSVVPGGMGPTRAAAIESIYSYSRNVLGFDLSSASLANSFAGAFQLVIWEIVYDYDGTLASLDITSGDFSATQTNGNPLTAAVQGWVDDLINNGVTYNVNANNLLGLYSDTYQDQIITIVIPTPTAAALGLLGLAGVATRRRR